MPQTEPTHPPPPQVVESVGITRSQTHYREWDSVPQALPPLEDRSWLWRHPGAVLTALVMIIGMSNWGLMHFLADSPAQKQTNAAIRGIRKDIRTMVLFQLEANRANRQLMGTLAGAHNLEYKQPRELTEAETSVRKLLNR